MSRFVDQYLNECVPGYPVFSSPRWSTNIAIVDSGAEQVNQNWSHPLARYTLPEAVRNMTIFNSIRDHWLVMRGPAYAFPFRDPLDFASLPLSQPNVAPSITDEDQIIGTSNGVQTKFQLVKKYAVGTQEYTRTIKLPIVSSVLINLHYTAQEIIDTPPPTFTVNRETGEVEFSFPPLAGKLITAGFLFDVPVRFESDTEFDGIVSTFSLGGYSDISLVEVRLC